MSSSNADSIAAINAERRQLRRDQTALYDKIVSKRDQLADIGGAAELESFREQNNQQFKRTKYVRESYNDVKNLNEIARAAKNQASRLVELDTQYDFDHLINGMSLMFDPDGTTGFSWTNIGREIQPLFRAVPVFNPVLGQISKVSKVRKAHERKDKKARDLNEVTEAPAEIQQTQSAAGGGDNEINEATNERIIRLFKTISAKGGQELDLLRLLVNPKDNVQTIENFFDFSFLVKDKRVAELADKKGIPRCMKTDPKSVGADQERKQLVLSISIKDLSLLNALLESSNYDEAVAIKAIHTLHRDDELYSAKNAHEQAEIIAERAKKVTKPKVKAGPKPARESSGGRSSQSEGGSFDMGDIAQ